VYEEFDGVQEEISLNHLFFYVKAQLTPLSNLL